MAKSRSPAPTLGDENSNPQAEQWQVPTVDQEFVFDAPGSLPGWADPNWASFDRGPALAVPAGDLYGEGPYWTKTARIGDTVKFIAATPSMAAHFEVIPGDMAAEDLGTTKPPQVTAASLEDLIKGGTLAVGDLGAEAKAQVESRSPRLKALLEGE